MISERSREAFLRDFRRLIEMAVESYDSDKALSRRYSKIAYMMILSKKVKPDRNEKILICKKCNNILIPGKSLVVRTERGVLFRKCLNCGNVRRIVYAESVRR